MLKIIQSQVPKLKRALERTVWEACLASSKVHLSSSFDTSLGRYGGTRSSASYEICHSDAQKAAIHRLVHAVQTITGEDPRTLGWTYDEQSDKAMDKRARRLKIIKPVFWCIGLCFVVPMLLLDVFWEETLIIISMIPLAVALGLIAWAWIGGSLWARLKWKSAGKTDEERIYKTLEEIMQSKLRLPF